MAERSGERLPEGRTERLARFGRNINVLGAVALGGAALMAPVGGGAVLGALAGINAVQAGGFEAARRYAKKRHR
ncbi:hypothetical protein CR970_03710 [Candidatus Saccharibacteria bacterium]|nr:MAG: hypothetical protein CR970_03710 [Candidatus Saccharibacteria bacterium]